MPRFDGTGPLGQGPMTGRGFGPCGFGLGWRRRFGFGRGMGRYLRGLTEEASERMRASFNWGWPETKKEQLNALKEYKKALQEELEDVDKEEKELAK